MGASCVRSCKSNRRRGVNSAVDVQQNDEEMTTGPKMFKAGEALAAHREDAVDMTWLCACGQVEFEVDRVMNIAHCYCDDCTNRVRIG